MVLEIWMMALEQHNKEKISKNNAIQKIFRRVKAKIKLNDMKEMDLLCTECNKPIFKGKSIISIIFLILHNNRPNSLVQ